MLRTVFEVKLEKEYGYCLVGVYDDSGHGIGASQIILPLDYLSESPISLTKEEMERIDELAAPILSLSKPPTRGPEKWRKIHEFEDGIAVSPPLCINDFTQKMRRVKNWNEIEWEVIYNMNTDYRKSFPFCAIAHLSDWGMGNRAFVKMNLTMLWMRVNGRDITSYYNTELTNTSEEFLYKRVMNMRLYADVPFEYRNKVWEEGCNAGR